jgi:hypothetical protein
MKHIRGREIWYLLGTNHFQELHGSIHFRTQRDETERGESNASFITETEHNISYVESWIFFHLSLLAQQTSTCAGIKTCN